MTFDEKLRNYARLLVRHGLNVQEGQVVNIGTEAIHRDLAVLVAEEAYQCGAKHVTVDLGDARVGRLRILQSKAEDLEYVPNWISVKYRDLVDETAANLRIGGSEDPDILSDLDPVRINTLRKANHAAVKYFYDEGIGKAKVHWTVAAGATAKWGQKVFPELGPEEACAALWDEIFTICRADKENCLELWQKHNEALHHRAAKLNELKIKTLHFRGPGTDLIVGLSEKAQFKGGGDLSPRGVEFDPNIPTEEVFTTPDYRMTSGKVRATRPFMINGKLIEGLELEFEAGCVSKFTAKSGKETFAEYISSDEGANRLGEVALVGIDSPVYQSGRVFQEILYDENAACHIAVGSAYKFCLRDGENLSAEGIAEIGCNESSVHTDMMISSEEVDVDAETYAGQTVPVIRSGAWCEGF